MPSPRKRAPQLLAAALALPEAWQDSPWGDTVAKVGKKIFAFISDERLGLKLVHSHAFALSLPGAEPTGYGLGKAGWVTLKLDAKAPPTALLAELIVESYTLVAPKKLVKLLEPR
jgi:predicted DNA-binding protein (MmcQ/YjbR family)